MKEPQKSPIKKKPKKPKFTITVPAQDFLRNVFMTADPFDDMVAGCQWFDSTGTRIPPEEIFIKYDKVTKKAEYIRKKKSNGDINGRTR